AATARPCQGRRSTESARQAEEGEGGMICATRRGVRRSTVAGRTKTKAIELDAVLRRFEAEKISGTLEGRPKGRRIRIYSIGSLRGEFYSAFAHPTKKMTRGRLVKLRSRASTDPPKETA